jgi:hypothetical protein
MKKMVMVKIRKKYKENHQITPITKVKEEVKEGIETKTE